MQVNGQTRVLGVIGHPIRHTLSPEIHRIFAEKSGQNTVYVPLEVEPDALFDALSGMRALHILGLNVTVPHKKSVIPFLDECSEDAKTIGAVNTIRFEGGRLIGHNTDGLGWKRSLEREGIGLSGARVALFGAGGAADAIGTTCAQSGAAEILIVNRTPERGERLAEKLRSIGANARAAASEELTEIDLAVNTTSLGMIPNPEKTPISDFSFMKPSGAVYDAVYAPRETVFLKKAKEAGRKTVSGIGMLIEQAVLSYEFFTGVKLANDVADELYRRLSFPNNIVLAGFMGTGKSTVGKCLAEKYSLAFLDTDEELEQRERMTVSEIFAQKGEVYFREREAALIKELSKRSGMVISLGGGAVLRKENLEMLQESGRLICLTASLDTILSRIGEGEGRPLLFKKSSAEIMALMAERKPCYDACPEQVETDGKTAEKITEEIVEKQLTTHE